MKWFMINYKEMIVIDKHRNIEYYVKLNLNHFSFNLSIRIYIVVFNDVLQLIPPN